MGTKVSIATCFLTAWALFTLASCLNISNCSPEEVYNASLYEFEVLNLFCNNASILVHYNLTGLQSKGLLEEPIYSIINLSNDVKIVGWGFPSGVTFTGIVPSFQEIEPDGLVFTVGKHLVLSCFLDFSTCRPSTPGFIDNFFPHQATLSTQNNSVQTTNTIATTATSAVFTKKLPSSKIKSAFSLLHLLWIIPSVISLLVLALVITHCQRFSNFVLKLKKSESQNENEEKKIAKLSKFDMKFSQKSEELFQKSKKQIKLFLVFSNDHLKHKDVVVNFVKFLQADLGFMVFCEIFQTQESAVDPCGWMETCLDMADKVLVLWSPGTSLSLNQKDNDLKFENDFCSPVLKRIKNDLFFEVNIGKYYFGYFDYCTDSSIPDAFRQPRFRHFRLMAEFDELYFRLKGIETYLPGGIIEDEKVKPDHYFNPNLNDYGAALKTSLSTMASLVKEKPGWYTEQRGSSTLPKVFHQNCENGKNEITNCRLEIIPPSPLLFRSIKQPTQKDEKNTSNNYYFHSSDQQNTTDAKQTQQISNQLNNNAGISNCPKTNKKASIDHCSSPQPYPRLNVNNLDTYFNQIPIKNEMVSQSQNESIQNSSSCDSGYSSALMSSNEKHAQLPVSLPREKITSCSQNKALYPQTTNDCEKLDDDHQSILFKKTSSANLILVSQKTEPGSRRPLQLAPLDTQTDPMNSLMSLNLLSASLDSKL